MQRGLPGPNREQAPEPCEPAALLHSPKDTMQQSTAELAAEKNAEKIAALNQARIEKFTKGLNSLESFDLDRVEKEVTVDEYRGALADDLKRIMSRAEAARADEKK
jgi:hypothetical protein